MLIVRCIFEILMVPFLTRVFWQLCVSQTPTPGAGPRLSTLYPNPPLGISCDRCRRWGEITPYVKPNTR